MEFLLCTNINKIGKEVRIILSQLTLLFINSIYFREEWRVQGVKITVFTKKEDYEYLYLYLVV